MAMVVRKMVIVTARNNQPFQSFHPLFVALFSPHRRRIRQIRFRRDRDSCGWVQVNSKEEEEGEEEDVMVGDPIFVFVSFVLLIADDGGGAARMHGHLSAYNIY
jgi:hypothetical protein